jgi:4-diphosphocytidyl-2-C-methyl-D-erythritol kinase
MRRLEAPAKINLALVVGPLRPDGKHEVATILQRIDLVDVVELSIGTELTVSGFADDTIVTGALTALAVAAGVEPCWSVRITKTIPVSAGLGGGSSDAAAALLLANDTLDAPFGVETLSEIAARIGADVPFFLQRGAQLGSGDGSRLAPLDLPLDFTVLLVLPHDAHKESTARVYADFDARQGAAGFEKRRAALAAALAALVDAEDLAALPPNDLATSPLVERLLRAGAIRADVSGAGPCVYAIFADPSRAREVGDDLRALGHVWVVAPVRGGPGSDRDTVVRLP